MHPSVVRAPLDKAAAARFIKHAITQSKLGDTAGNTSQEAEPSTFVPIKITSKMIERAEHEAELRARGDASSSEDEMEIIDGGDTESVAPTPKKGKGKAKEILDVPVVAGSKRRRPVIDPFAGEPSYFNTFWLWVFTSKVGFGDEPDSAQTEEIDETEKKKRKKDKKKAKKGDDDTQPNSTQIEDIDQAEKKRRKKEKKKAKKGDDDDTSSSKSTKKATK